MDPITLTGIVTGLLPFVTSKVKKLFKLDKIKDPTKQKFANQLLGNGQRNGMYELLKSGWQRVTYIGNQLYAYNPNQPPNNRQASELVDLAIMN